MPLGDRPCRLDDRRRRLLVQIMRRVVAWQGALGKAALDPRVLAAIARIPREAFVPRHLRPLAYEDQALDIACRQRISQPSIVAVMTDLLEPEPQHRVLEVGTGSGYQTAVLSQLAAEVFSVELEEDLAADAVLRLARLGCANVALRVGDGAEGWEGRAPFDRILVTAAAATVPPTLPAQLKPGGRMVLPLGPQGKLAAQAPWHQQLVVIDKESTGRLTRRAVMPVRFVPLPMSRPASSDADAPIALA